MVYIEAQTGDERQTDKDLFIKGQFEVVKEDNERIYLREDRLTIPVLKSKIKSMKRII